MAGKKGTSTSGAELADAALAPKADHADVERRIAELSPEEAKLFAELMTVALRKRRWLLIGYLFALVAVLVGMVTALYVYGTYGRDHFVGWVFILPPGLAGLVMWLIGRHVKRLG
jgi:hypothetical protein